MVVTVVDRESYRSVLAKGLGRALQGALATAALTDEAAMLDACLQNRCFDPQLEGSRASWLIEILTAANAVDRFQAPILKALSESSRVWDVAQLCDLAEFYARRGIAAAREGLYQTFERGPDPSAPWLAEEQIVRLDGLSGFLRIAERRGAAIRRGEEVWDLPDLVSEVERNHGAEAVARALEDSAIRSQDIRAYDVRLQDERQRQREMSSKPRLKRSDRMRAITADQILTAIDVGQPSVGRSDLVGWGPYAPKEALRALASRMFEERDPTKIAKYLRIFSRVPLPEFDDRLIELSNHSDGEVSRGAMYALAENKAPAVRALALRRLGAGRADGNTIALLKCNYEPNDHRLLESNLVPSDDVHAMHELCLGLEDVFSENKTRDSAVAMRFAYEHTPCSICRERFVARLLEFNEAPPELLEECRFDANSDIRELVAAT